MSRRGIGFLVVLILVSMMLVPATAGAQEGVVGPDNPAEFVQNGKYVLLSKESREA